jgi:O-antigen/teichoic acid export membrane protein
VRYLACISIIGGIFNLILSLILGKAIGIEGVMVASAIVEVIVMVMFGVYCLRLMNISFTYLWRKSIIPAIKANCFVIPVVVYTYKQNIPANLSSFIVWLLVFTIIIIMGTITTGLSKSEFRDIHNYFGGIFSKLYRMSI